VALAAPAQAAVTSSLSGTTATLSGSDTVTITQSGVDLAHDRFAAGDPGFASATDWDATQDGTQPLPAGTSGVVNATGGTPVVVDDSASSTAHTVAAGTAGMAVSGLVDVAAVNLTVKTESGADNVS
jgi:hypothetical protein